MGLHPLGPKKFSRRSARRMTTSRLREHSPSTQVTISPADWMRTTLAVETRIRSAGSFRYSPAE